MASRRPARVPVALVVILALGIGIRMAYVHRPLDHRIRTAWRQSDSVAIARNFFREGVNIFYPRIDWRGDGPGYAEMELPLLPWTAAVLYRMVGYREFVQRLFSGVLESAGLLLFAWLAGALLHRGGALVATAAFAANPLLVYFASAMQPEPLMHVLVLVTIALVVRWTATPRLSLLVAAAAAAAGAMLIKAQAAFLVPVLVYAVLRTRGRTALADPGAGVAAAVAILPPLLWYAWARHLWTTYGNSLGLSNEAHLIGLDLIVPPWFLVSNAMWDTIATFTPAGVVLALATLTVRGRTVRLAFPWYVAVWAIYVIHARTAVDPYGGVYYHSASVAPGCLLMGAGFAALDAGRVGRWSAERQRRLARLLAGLTLAGLVGTTAALLYLRDYRSSLAGTRRCALEFLEHVGPTGTIVTDGGPRWDHKGYPIEHSDSTFFAWMDRKGFVYAEEELSVPLLDDIARRGGRYWIAAHGELERNGLREAAEQRYGRLADCTGGYALYDLTPRPERD